ncbi:MAG: NAD-dependent epimerase/dehydratase family protein, partial [Anaerolineaceae bacterium]|nr:NAD-dependent epimerase/dehydratase family protein [Anaerolineaceae bacterium]
MKVLLAGGSGLIGQALACRLLENGHQVWGLTRTPQGKYSSESNQEGVVWVGWDGRTTQGWGHLAGQVDAIINLSGANIGERRWTEARKRVIRASRVEAGKAIVAAVEQSTHRPALVIQIAGVGYYGPHGDEPLDEQSPPGKDYLASVAVDWENVTKPVTAFGVRLVTMRTGVVLTRQG